MASAGSRDRRVLIIVENLPLPFDRRVWQEANALRSAGYEVSIICPDGMGYDAGHEVIDDIHIYRYRQRFEARGILGYALEYGEALFWQTLLAWRVFFGRGFDVIHACNPPDTIFMVGLPFKLLFRRKFLFDHHDINPELFVAKFGRNKGLAYRLVLWLERATFWSADVSIATNESYKAIAIRRGRMAPERVFVVRSGPDLNRMRTLPPVPALKRGRRFLVGYVGVIGKQEGMQYLIGAARHLVEAMGRTDVHFAVVGGGSDLENVKQLASDEGVAEYFTFTGRVPDQTLLEVLNTADVCVNPDEFNEMNDKSTMNKIMDYMSLAKPIVQFDLAEGRYSAGESSLYAARNDAVDLAEKIAMLLDDPERREKMGRAGRERVERELAWQYQVPRLLEAYATLWKR